jgi:hypothetical protein
MLLALLLVPAVADATQVPVSRCPDAQSMGALLGAGADRVEAACRAAVTLQRAGWSEPWVVGALANAWHESGWNPRAVGDHGHAVGFWQLRDDGLGSGMGDLRYDLRHATDRVIRSARRQKLRTDKGDVRHAADKFCQLIMRPSDKVRKGEQRASAAARLSADDSI